MDRYTRRQLKEDELKSVFQGFEQFAKSRYKELLGGLLAVILIGGAGAGLKIYSDRQEAAANADLGTALKTFHAYVGASAPSFGFDTQSYPTAQEKYKKALGEFADVARKYPHRKAGVIARYHQGVCQAEMGDHAAAVKTLEEAAHASDPGIAALAKLALAGEYASTGKLPEAEKLYQSLADHPTLTVPKATALLALAGAERATNPAKSRQIYEGLLNDKDLGSDNMLVSLLREEMADLPK